MHNNHTNNRNTAASNQRNNNNNNNIHSNNSAKSTSNNNHDKNDVGMVEPYAKGGAHKLKFPRWRGFSLLPLRSPIPP